MSSIRDYVFYTDFNILRALTGEASAIIILTDSNTSKYCLPLLSKELQTPFLHIEVPPGELRKTPETLMDICTQMLEGNIDRKALLLNLGGGVITDMGGFAACIYKRGIDYIQLPTTLLSMVDAAIGGKNGIDFMGYKNLLGIIKQPNAVGIFPEFLKTLSDKELRSGAAEIIKAALISDMKWWKEIQSIDRLSLLAKQSFIQRAIKIKQHIVSTDPYEKGMRKILNFGHTIGHAIESFYLTKSDFITHGEAVAIGMYYETLLSSIYGTLPVGSAQQINKFLRTHYTIPTFSPKEIEQLIEIMKYDKKNAGSTILGIRLESIGVAQWDQLYPPEQIRKVLSGNLK